MKSPDSKGPARRFLLRAVDIMKAPAIRLWMAGILQAAFSTGMAGFLTLAVGFSSYSAALVAFAIFLGVILLFSFLLGIWLSRALSQVLGTAMPMAVVVGASGSPSPGELLAVGLALAVAVGAAAAGILIARRVERRSGGKTRLWAMAPIVGGLLVAASLAFPLVGIRWLKEYVYSGTFAEFRLSPRMSLRLRWKFNDDPGQPLYLHLESDGEESVYWICFSYSSSVPQYRLITPPGSRIVGLVNDNEPDAVFAVVDVETGQVAMAEDPLVLDFLAANPDFTQSRDAACR